MAMAISILAETDHRMKKNKTGVGVSTLYAGTSDFMPIIEERIRAGHSVEIAVRGKSMRPLLKEGRDSVILSPITKELKKYDIPLYKRLRGGYVIHRTLGLFVGGYTMIGDNQFAYEKGIKEEQIIAVVTAIKRRGRVIPITRIDMRLYAVIWHFTRPLRHLPIRVLGRLKRIVERK